MEFFGVLDRVTVLILCAKEDNDVGKGTQRQEEHVSDDVGACFSDDMVGDGAGVPPQPLS